MKKFAIIIVVLLSFAETSFAQVSEPIYLLPDFTEGTIFFKDKSTAKVPLNIDIANNRVMYMQGGVMMEMTNLFYTDSITVSDKKFVNRELTPCEIVKRDKYDLLVGWHIKNVHLGQKGALGQTTQATVITVHVKDLYINAGNEEFDPNKTAVWREVSNNTYYLCLKGKEYKISSIKDVYKAFPSRKDDIKKYVKDQKLNIQKAENAILIFDYLCDTIEQ